MKSRLHETGTYKNLQMEIVAYREAMDIDVEFSNGFILQHTRYYNFQHRIFPMCVIRYHETSSIKRDGHDDCRISDDNRYRC